MSSIPRLNAGGSNHQLYKGKGLSLKQCLKCFDLREQCGQKVDANYVSQSMRKARNVDGFLMFDATNHKFSNRRAVRVGDSEEEDEEEPKLHERENELKILQEILSKKWASSSHNV